MPEAENTSSAPAGHGYAADKQALESVALRILDDHVNHCVANALASGDPDIANQKTRELLDAVKRFNASR